MRRSVLILFALFACLGAAACGQKGPLKLPPDSPKLLVSVLVSAHEAPLSSTSAP